MSSKTPSLYQIEATIRTALAAPLPGREAHATLAPRPHRGWEPGHIPEGARRAAGLLLLYPLYDAPHILLTVRANALPTHAGQVSLPGGELEGYETVAEAALREAGEEVGLESASVRVLGSLSTLYIPVSDFALHPVVGICDERPAWRAEIQEVDRLLEVRLDELLSGTRLRRGGRWRRDQWFQVPYFEVGEERVWGATAMVLSELLAVLGSPARDPWDA